MKTPHSEILKNWVARAAKLQNIWSDVQQPPKRRTKAFSVWYTLKSEIRKLNEQ